MPAGFFPFVVDDISGLGFCQSLDLRRGGIVLFEESIAKVKKPLRLVRRREKGV